MAVWEEAVAAEVAVWEEAAAADLKVAVWQEAVAAEVTVWEVVAADLKAAGLHGRLLLLTQRQLYHRLGDNCCGCIVTGWFE